MDPIAIIGDLRQRVTRLEQANARRTPRVNMPDPATAVLLAMHRTMLAEEDRDIAAITRWLKTPTKKNGPVAAGPFQSPTKGN